MGLNHVNPAVALWPPKTDEDRKSHKCRPIWHSSSLVSGAKRAKESACASWKDHCMFILEDRGGRWLYSNVLVSLKTWSDRGMFHSLNIVVHLFMFFIHYRLVLS